MARDWLLPAGVVFIVAASQSVFHSLAAVRNLYFEFAPSRLDMVDLCTGCLCE